MCSGESSIGDLRIDQYNPKANIKADCCYLPIKSKVVDCVILDPPWLIDYREKAKMLFEAIRVLKLGGILYITDPSWWPSNPLLKVEERQIFPQGWFKMTVLHKLIKIREHLFW